MAEAENTRFVTRPAIRLLRLYEFEFDSYSDVCFKDEGRPKINKCAISMYHYVTYPILWPRLEKKTNGQMNSLSCSLELVTMLDG